MEELQKVPSVFDKLDKLNNPDPFPQEEQHDSPKSSQQPNEQKDERKTEHKTVCDRDLDNAVFEPSEELQETQPETHNRNKSQYQSSSTFDTEHASQPNG